MLAYQKGCTFFGAGIGDEKIPARLIHIHSRRREPHFVVYQSGA